MNCENFTTSLMHTQKRFNIQAGYHCSGAGQQGSGGRSSSELRRRWTCHGERGNFRRDQQPLPGAISPDASLPQLYSTEDPVPALSQQRPRDLLQAVVFEPGWFLPGRLSNQVEEEQPQREHELRCRSKELYKKGVVTLRYLEPTSAKSDAFWTAWQKAGGGLTECTEPACGSGGETHRRPGDLKNTATRSSTFRLLSGSTSRRGKRPLQHLTPPLNKGKKTTIYAWFRLFLPPLRKRGSKLPEHLFLLRGRRPQLWIWVRKLQLLQNGPRADCHPDDHCLDPWGRAVTHGGTSLLPTPVCIAAA